MSATEHSSAQAALAASERDADRFYGKYRGIVARQRRPARRSAACRAMVPGGARRDVPTRLGAAVRAVRRDGRRASSRSRRSAPGCGSSSRPATPSRPIWTGGWWGTGEVPMDEEATPSLPSRKILRSDSGLMVSLDDPARRSRSPTPSD